MRGAHSFRRVLQFFKASRQALELLYSFHFLGVTWRLLLTENVSENVGWFSENLKMHIFERVVLIHFVEFCKSFSASRPALERLYSLHFFVGSHGRSFLPKKRSRSCFILYVLILMFGAIFLRVAWLKTLEVNKVSERKNRPCLRPYTFSRIILGQLSYRKNAVPKTFHYVCAHLYSLGD